MVAQHTNLHLSPHLPRLLTLQEAQFVGAEIAISPPKGILYLSSLRLYLRRDRSFKATPARIQDFAAPSPNDPRFKSCLSKLQLPNLILRNPTLRLDLRKEVFTKTNKPASCCRPCCGLRSAEFLSGKSWKLGRDITPRIEKVAGDVDLRWFDSKLGQIMEACCVHQVWKGKVSRVFGAVKLRGCVGM